MFTGIIEEVGKVKELRKKNANQNFTIATKSILKNKKIGESIAVNGACMTITKISGNTFQFDAMPESLELTNLADIKEGEEVNLETALSINKGLDGHIVQGHIDCTEETIELKKDDKKDILKIKIPKKIKKYICMKGSITINGVSLTISKLTETSFSVDLIPHTLKNTNLNKLKKGDKVNLEADIIAKYLENLLKK
jgi:riboflavin synthase